MVNPLHLWGKRAREGKGGSRNGGIRPEERREEEESGWLCCIRNINMVNPLDLWEKGGKGKESAEREMEKSGR